MLASDDTYVRLDSCQILANTCMQISLDFLDITYFPHIDKEIVFPIEHSIRAKWRVWFANKARRFTTNKCWITLNSIVVSFILFTSLIFNPIRMIISEIISSTIFNTHNVQVNHSSERLGTKRRKGNMLNLNEILVVKLDICVQILPSSPSSISGGLWCSDDSIPWTPSLSAPAVVPPSSPISPTGWPCKWHNHSFINK